MADIANDADNVWTDAANVDAHVQLGWTYDYYYSALAAGGWTTTTHLSMR